MLGAAIVLLFFIAVFGVPALAWAAAAIGAG